MDREYRRWDTSLRRHRHTSAPLPDRRCTELRHRWRHCRRHPSRDSRWCNRFARACRRRSASACRASHSTFRSVAPCRSRRRRCRSWRTLSAFDTIRRTPQSTSCSATTTDTICTGPFWRHTSRNRDTACNRSVQSYRQCRHRSTLFLRNWSSVARSALSAAALALALAHQLARSLSDQEQLSVLVSVIINMKQYETIQHKHKQYTGVFVVGFGVGFGFFKTNKTIRLECCPFSSWLNLKLITVGFGVGGFGVGFGFFLYFETINKTIRLECPFLRD